MAAGGGWPRPWKLAADKLTFVEPVAGDYRPGFLGSAESQLYWVLLWSVRWILSLVPVFISALVNALRKVQTRGGCGVLRVTASTHGTQPLCSVNV